MTARTQRADAGAGFTLVELLVAMTLIGLIAVVMFGGLRFGTRVWEAGDRRSEAFAQVDVAQALLRRQLDRTVALPRDDGGITFAGTEDWLSFTAPAPSQFGLGGIYEFELYKDSETGQDDLVLRWQLYRPDPDERSELLEPEERALIENVEALRIRYYGDPDEEDEPDWNDQWGDTEVLPSLVSVEVAFGGEDPRYWPALVVAPKASLGTLLQ